MFGNSLFSMKLMGGTKDLHKVSSVVTVSGHVLTDFSIICCGQFSHSFVLDVRGKGSKYVY
jgi:hypothetical protein